MRCFYVRSPRKKRAFTHSPPRLPTTGPIPKSIPYAPVTNAKLAPCNITYYLYQATAVTPQNYLKVQLNTSMYCNKKSCVGAANPRGFDPTVSAAKFFRATIFFCGQTQL